QRAKERGLAGESPGPLLGGQFHRRVQAVVELLGLQQQRRCRNRTAVRSGKDRLKRRTGGLLAAVVPIDGFRDLQPKDLTLEVEADTPAVGVDFADGGHRWNSLMDE